MKIKQFCLGLGLTTIGSAASIFLPIATLPVKALTWNLSNVNSVEITPNCQLPQAI